MQDEIAEEIQRQLAEGNGADTEATRGMTLRELVLDVRDEVKGKASRKELYSVITFISGVALAVALAL